MENIVEAQIKSILIFVSYDMREAVEKDLREMLRPNQELLEKSVQLREAQKAYMADRGNNQLGRAVAEAAQELDVVILKATSQKV